MSNVTQISQKINQLTREFNIIAHNLANVNTVGYKRRLNNFSKTLEAQQGDSNSQDDPMKIKPAIDFTQGSFVHTGRKLDFALSGAGFFVIETPQGPLYTRKGAFQLDSEGKLVDSLGRPVAGESGPISLPPNVSLHQIHVTADGKITADGSMVGKFKLVTFVEDQEKIQPVGLNCFKVPEGIEPEDAVNLVVKQGYQESSNVHMMEELVDMIMVTRLYESNVQFITAKKDTSKSLLNLAMS